MSKLISFPSRVFGSYPVLIFCLLALASITQGAIRVVTNLNDAGPGSLRATLANAVDGDVLTFAPELFDASVPQTISLRSGQLTINISLTIEGPGDLGTDNRASLVLDPDRNDRAITISGKTTVVTISGLGIANGRAKTGGAVLISDGSEARFLRCDFDSNESSREGGAIYNEGILSLDQCLLIDNYSRRQGGAIYNLGSLLITRSLVQNNRASRDGGGLASIGEQAWIESSTFSGNRGSSGGGLSFLTKGGSETSGHLQNVTVVDNEARFFGGGLIVQGKRTTVSLSQALIAGNVAKLNRRSFPSDTISWAFGKMESDGYNLIQYPFFFWGAQPTDQFFADPKLLPLADNGGRTATYALEPSSPALDGGDPEFTGGVVETDQRGFPRNAPGVEGISDIGAYEAAEPSITCPGSYVFTCTGFSTLGPLTAEIIVPGADSANVEWIINGETCSTDPIELPGDETPVQIEFTGSFSSGLSTVEVVVMVDGYELRCEAEVEVVDLDPPSITLIGPSRVVVECGESYSEAGASAIDSCDGELPVSIDASAVDPSSPGVYMVHYRAVDGAGNPASKARIVEIVDDTPPILAGEVPDLIIFELTDGGSCSLLVSALPLSLEAIDGCDSDPFVVLQVGLDGGPLVLPAVFPVGSTQVTARAVDAAGNSSPPQSFEVVVEDHVAPNITLIGAETLTVALGDSFSDPGVDAVDGCSEPAAITRTVDGDPDGSVDTCLPGSYEILYTATDSAGNSASVSRTVTVGSNLVLSAPELVERTVESPACDATIDLSAVVSVEGLPAACADELIFSATITLRNDEVQTIALDEPFAFPVGTSSVVVEAILAPDESSPLVLATAAFDVRVDDPFYACLPNVIWPLAIPLNTPLVEGSSSLRSVFFQQVLTKPGESRWFRVQGVPGGQIRVFLQNLPADYNVVVYGDIQEAYEELIGLIESDDEASKLLALLGAEFAPEAYAPEAYSPEAYSPEAYAPEAYAPEAYAPEAYAPEAYAPEAYAPEAYAPEAYAPEAYAPEAYAPEAYAPEAYAPEAYAPEAYSPEAYAPEAYAPEAYAPEAYASAQQRSLIAFSATPGKTGEEVIFNTYSRSGEIYIRVRGRNGIADPEHPFDLIVEVESEICDGVTETDTSATVTPTVAGTPSSLLVWDSTRVAGSPAEVADLALALESFAGVANGLVLDVGLDPKIALLNAQADASPACPFAKNLVAEAIRQLILAYREAAPSIADITLLGDDDDIPFFRTNDEAGLASEANYFPPVFDGTHSQSSLRLAQVLTQDRYGALCRVYLSTGPYDLPEIPVARLVENAGEISAYLRAYEPLFDGTISTGGLLPAPDSAISIGYDFLADSAVAIRDELSLGLAPGDSVDTLISAIDVPPVLGWTADDLRTSLLGQRHDLSYVAGHFSTSGVLAADYATRLTAGEVAASPVDLLYALIVTPGCHSGYNTVDGDAIPFVTEQPDWAQAMSRKGALFLSGTGYQYGDTDFIEYTERLQLEFFRQLRSGTGPVPVGRAMVAAKRQYLRDTALMRGIHEKSLTQLTLYGLPMVKLDFPGARLPTSSATSSIASTTPSEGPGSGYGLRVGQLEVVPSLTRVDRLLKVVGSLDESVIASFWEGSGGVVALPGEPVRARESFNLSRPTDGFVRGIGFRGGAYEDLPGFRPLTGAPATESRGVHGSFLSEVLYPPRQWNLNQIGELCDLGGSSILSVFPIQYLSSDLESDTGTARKFTAMDFDVFYCPVVTATALANPVSINLVSSEYADGNVHFSVEVAISGEIGVENVWITFTGLEGSPYHGEWISLDLSTPESARGIGTWEGVLSLLPGTHPADLRFMVQAVNSIGVTTFNANFGRFFKLDESTIDGIGVTSDASVLTFITNEGTPTAGEYRSILPVSALLTDAEGTPISGAPLVFKIGPISLPAITGEDGTASALLPLDTRPGSYELEVAFGGDADFDESRDTRSFAIQKALTTLEFEESDDFTRSTATLMALNGTPLKERTILFVIEGEAFFEAIPVITDGAGQATFSTYGFLPGSYAVSVYFGQTVEISEGIEVPLTDPLYGPASDSIELIIGDAVEIGPFSVEAIYESYEDEGAYTESATESTGARVASVSIAVLPAPTASLSQVTANGTFELVYPESTFGAFVSPLEGGSINASVRVTLSDQTVVDGNLSLLPTNPNRSQWRAQSKLNGNVVNLSLSPTYRDEKRGRFTITIDVAPGSGPAFSDTPDMLELVVAFSAGEASPVVTGTLAVGTEDRPWTLVDFPIRSYTGP